MLTWHVDRLLRSGPVCAIVTLLLPMAMAFAIAGLSDADNAISILLLAAGVMGIGSLAGSVLTTGLGAIFFSFGTFVAEINLGLMVLVSGLLFSILIVHDLSGMFRRAPQISRSLWRQAATVCVAVMAVSAAAFGLTYFVATRATWQSIVVPFGLAAIGFAAKLGADSHATSARVLTRKGANQALALADEQPTTASQSNSPKGDKT